MWPNDWGVGGGGGWCCGHWFRDLNSLLHFFTNMNILLTDFSFSFRLPTTIIDLKRAYSTDFSIFWKIMILSIIDHTIHCVNFEKNLPSSNAPMAQIISSCRTVPITSIGCRDRAWLGKMKLYHLNQCFCLHFSMFVYYLALLWVHF